MTIGDIWNYITTLNDLSNLKQGLFDLYLKKPGEKFENIEQRISQINEQMDKIKQMEI